MHRPARRRLERQQRLQVENSFLRPAYEDEDKEEDSGGDDDDESVEEIRELRKMEADLERRQRSILRANDGSGGGEGFGDDDDDDDDNVYVEQLNDTFIAQGRTGPPAESALPRSKISISSPMSSHYNAINNDNSDIFVYDEPSIHCCRLFVCDFRFVVTESILKSSLDEGSASFHSFFALFP